MKPKQWIKYVKKLEKKGYAICDGVTGEMTTSAFDILYPLFILSGVGIFMWILVNWTRVKEKIKK